ncbi:helix-turn-helix transcriptional regulator [uncultured Alistipes sp.]|uniref:helix-turn-helix domain-containing protein n=1 Tax=uncultured Alistipes sp. TaxID=538949 RepID=UPI0025E7F548|nr:helix-turn-helix transcriptional regulator [uncultured Alistipes sp.]
MSKFRILELCKEKGITQKDLAEKIGMSPVGLAKAANGNPTVETLEKIAAGLSVSVSELFTPKSNTLVCPKCGTVLEVKERE